MKSRSILDGPPIHRPFVSALEELIEVARGGQRPDSEFFNPDDAWLTSRMRIFSELPPGEQEDVVEEFERLRTEAEETNAEGKAAQRVGPDAVFRLDSGGLGFYSQLGVARRPDLTQYFVEGFLANRDALSFSEENQELFADVLPHISRRLREAFDRGDTVIQTDRQICDVPERSFHARQLLCGDRYLQIPYMWRRLTFDLPRDRWTGAPDIIELSLPRWLEDVDLPEAVRKRVEEAGLTQLVFKAPSRGLSLHLGMDYVGEHKMGPLSLAMFQVKQKNGIALQAALSVARITALNGSVNNAAIVTTGPSLHGKSTLTIMLDPRTSDLADRLGLERDGEGVFPMNDDIVLLQPLPEHIETTRPGRRCRVYYGIDGTENHFYAVPFGLSKEDDPITYEVLRGTDDEPYAGETLENVVVDPESGAPDFTINPTRNMRAIFSRPRLIKAKGEEKTLDAITGGRLQEAVHVPMENLDRILWQGVMRENTVIPPMRRVNLEQYVRVLMYGEAVQMGAAAGAIGKPYVEYFSDPFIMGLEDENANLLYHTLRKMEWGGLRMEYYIFNTGGVGAESREQTSGPRYKKIPRELTLMLQEAVLRDAVVFEYEPAIGSESAAAIVDSSGREIVDLRKEWLPRAIYGDEDYEQRMLEVRRRRFYGLDDGTNAGILRYTKVNDAIIDVVDIPTPTTERELTWLLSFYWYVDRVYDTLPELVDHTHEGMHPAPHLQRELQQMYDNARAEGLELSAESGRALAELGIHGGR